MSYEPVDVYVFDTTPQKLPIAGVVVKVLNAQGTLVYGLATTDSDGKVSFLLEAPITYQMRFFKRGVNIKNPQIVGVVPAPEVNQFDVSGEVFQTPVSINPRLCVASGYFLRGDGSPAPHVDIHFIAKFNPVLLEDDVVLTERVTVKTDKRGYAELELIRYGKYDVTVEGFEDYQRLICVPNQPNVNLPDLLFPRVESVSFVPPPPYSLAVGEEVVIVPVVATSDKNVLEGTAMEDVQWSSSDTNILAVLPSTYTLTLRGIAPGTAELRCCRQDGSVIKIPNTDIEGQPVPITVT